MGQNESKSMNDSFTHNSGTENQVNIKIDDNHKDRNESNGADNRVVEYETKKVKKLNSHDFASTIFYGMVALLVFSTMSNTYRHYSGGGCGALNGIQPMLAYTCVGLACALIRSLRKQLKDQTKNVILLSSEDIAEEEGNSDSIGYEVMKETPPVPIAPEFKSGYCDADEKNSRRETKNVSFMFDSPFAEGFQYTRPSIIAPLPPLPTPNTMTRRQSSPQSGSDLNVLSAVELKSIETNVTKQEQLNNKLSEDLNSYVKTYDWNQLQRENSHHLNNHNWIDYNLDNFRKY